MGVLMEERHGCVPHVSTFKEEPSSSKAFVGS